MQWFFLINPYAGGRRSKSRLASLKKALANSRIQASLAISHSPEDGQRLIQEAIDKGFSHFVVVGGDGSINNVLQVLMQQDKPERFTLSNLGWGTGNDWAKTHKLPKSAKAFIRFLEEATAQPHDIGRVSYGDAQQESKQHYFINSAGCGFDSFILKRMGSAGGNRLAYYKHLILGLNQYQAKSMHRTSEQTQSTGLSLMTMACISPYAGGGMHFAPRANTQDGLLDIINIQDMPLLKRIASLPFLLNGKIENHPLVDYQQTKQLKLELDDTSQHLAFQCDGELVGQLPIAIGLAPQAIQVLSNKE